MREDNNRKRAGVLGILGALWLILGCLMACGTALLVEETTTVGQTQEETTTGAGNAGSRMETLTLGETQEEKLSSQERQEEAATAGEAEKGTATAGKEEKGIATAGKDENKDVTEDQPDRGMTGTEGGGAGLSSPEAFTETAGFSVDESASYTAKEEVALYLHLYGHLPDNYITKREAESLGWDSRQGNLWEVAPGKSIGGSRFGNYEGALPEKEGRKYYECDIDFDGGYRGPKRIIYSDDGLIFFTGDHYKTFEKLYGE